MFMLIATEITDDENVLYSVVVRASKKIHGKFSLIDLAGT